MCGRLCGTRPRAPQEGRKASAGRLQAYCGCKGAWGLVACLGCRALRTVNHNVEVTPGGCHGVARRAKVAPRRRERSRVLEQVHFVVYMKHARQSARRARHGGPHGALGGRPARPFGAGEGLVRRGGGAATRETRLAHLPPHVRAVCLALLLRAPWRAHGRAHAPLSKQMLCCDNAQGHGVWVGLCLRLLLVFARGRDAHAAAPNALCGLPRGGCVYVCAQCPRGLCHHACFGDFDARRVQDTQLLSRTTS